MFHVIVRSVGTAALWGLKIHSMVPVVSGAHAFAPLTVFHGNVPPTVADEAPANTNTSAATTAVTVVRLASLIRGLKLLGISCPPRFR
jgi:hypothetical protein